MSVAKYEKKLMEKNFQDSTFKDAYKQAMKWIAKNIISNDELKGIEINFTKKDLRTTKLPTITIVLSVGIDEKEIRDRHCKMCKDFHSSWFANENCNCSWCKAVSYQKRADFMIEPKYKYYKEILKKVE